jgi:hypothetical protein
MRRAVAFGVVGALAGVVAGQWLEHRAMAVDLARLGARLDDLPRAPPGALHCTASLDGAELRAHLQRALAELPGRAPAVADPGRAGAVEAPLPPEPTPEQEDALARGRTLTADALSTGRWSAHDVETLRTLLPRLAPEGRDELMHLLVPAVNTGRLIPEAGSLF